MKYLIVVLFILSLACEKETEQGYCWECTSTAENYAFFAIDSTVILGDVMRVTTTKSLRDMTKQQIIDYEKRGTDMVRTDFGLVIVMFKIITKCSLTYTISYEQETP